MKIQKKPLEQLSEDSKKAAPLWDRVVVSTPVVLTVVATLLAGLSSSEMTLAQYHRSLAAQNQSKAGDQWNFFQAKRDRQAGQESTLDILHSVTETGGADAASIAAGVRRLPGQLQAAAPASLRASVQKLKSRTAALLDDTQMQKALALLDAEELPAPAERPIPDDKVRQAVEAVAAGQTEEETAGLVAQVRESSIRDALAAAQANSDAFDRLTKPPGQALDKLGAAIGAMADLARSIDRTVRTGDADPAAGTTATAPATGEASGSGAPASAKAAAAVRAEAERLNADFTAARLRFTAKRYARDARYNQATAQLYEVQVRKSGQSAEHHRDRSKQFFYGMLAAQAGVTIATLSLAVQQRSLIWSLAAVAGLGAVGFGGYVYLFS